MRAHAPLASLRLEPVEPVGEATILVPCPCGGRGLGCPGMMRAIHKIPPAETASAGMQLRTYRVSLGLPKALAAERLGITRDQLVELERGLARCEWSRARDALVYRMRAEA